MDALALTSVIQPISALLKRPALENSSIDFMAPGPRSLGFYSPSHQVKMISFPGINWPVKKVANRDEGVAVATYNTPSAPVEVNGGTFKSTLEGSTLDGISGREDEFSNFIMNIITKPSHTLVISGNSDIWLGALGTSRSSEPSGADSSKTITVTHHFTRLEQPSEHRACEPRDSVFNMLNDNGDLVGVAKIPDLYLAIGDSFVTATATFADSDAYNTLTTKSNTFTIAGFEGSAKHSYLAKALCAIRSPFTLPKLETV
ncbi:hypothetical protein BX616_009075 [Lobosporangium transversale]|nr:hypothetical protein BX616_009075 [Lobosporangium transversale]